MNQNRRHSNVQRKVAISLLILLGLIVFGAIVSAISSASADTLDLKESLKVQESEARYYKIIALIGWVCAVAASFGFVIQWVRHGRVSKYRESESKEYDKKLWNKESEIQLLETENIELKRRLEAKKKE